MASVAAPEEENSSAGNVSFGLIAYLFLMLGLSLSAGRTSWYALLLLGLSAMAMAAALWRSQEPSLLHRLDPSKLLAAIVGLSILLSAFFFWRMVHHQSGPYVLMARGLYVFAVILFVAYLSLFVYGWRKARRAGRCPALETASSTAENARRHEGDLSDGPLKGRGQNLRRVCFLLLCVCALFIQALLIADSPDPRGNYARFQAQGTSDVLVVLHYGLEQMLHGRSPYVSEPHFSDAPQVRTLPLDYWPGSLLPLLPFYVLGDARYGYLLALALSAWLLFSLASSITGAKQTTSPSLSHSPSNLQAPIPDPYSLTPTPDSRFPTPYLAEGLVLALLYFPRLPFMIELAWTEPLQLLCIVLLFWVMWRRPSSLLVGLCLALLLASKQYTILLVPFLLRGRHLNLRQLLLAVLITLLLLAPFALWSFEPFWQKTILFPLRLAGRPPTPEGLTILALFHQLTGRELPSLWTIVPGLIVYAVLIWRQPLGLRGCVGTSALALLIFWMTQRIGGLNYFFPVLGLSLLHLALCQERTRQANPTE